MAKADYSRDYYADLELPSTADVNDIKKQFRKLALKYHPDRNPGKEQEVNAKFQIIQSAHEILTSPEQKAKYDANRVRSGPRYPGASGVRGNPWQDVSSHYPAPPRRPGQAPTSAARNSASTNRPSTASASSSSAHRYSSFNVPPTAKTRKEDLDSRYTAWKNMRPHAAPPKSQPGPSASAAYAAAGAGTGASTAANKRPANPPASHPSSSGGGASSMPPPPPRTASQKQKAEASFGASRRNTGFFPRSPMGDEPPASNTNNYFTNRTHSRGYFFGEQPDSQSTPADPSPFAEQRRASDTPSTAYKNKSDESFFDTRQSTPYQTHGGEKLNPFDGIPTAASASDLNRTRSHRAATPQANKPEFRRRSSSLPDESDNAAKASARNRAGATSTAQQQNAPTSGTNANTSAPRSGSRTRSGARPRPSYPSSASPMPQFEEQYRRMQQGEPDDPFTTPDAKHASQNTQASPSHNQSHGAAGQTARGAGEAPLDGKSRPILYAQSPLLSSAYFYAAGPPAGTAGERHAGAQWYATFQGDAAWSCSSAYAPPIYLSPQCRTGHSRKSSSGDMDDNSSTTGSNTNKKWHKVPAGLTAFERKQFRVLRDLVNTVEVFDPNAEPGNASRQEEDQKRNGRESKRQRKEEKERYCHDRFVPVDLTNVANAATSYSSNLSLDDDVFSTPTSPLDREQANAFMSSSAEDINTRFVHGDGSNSQWEFSAGGPSEGESAGDFPARVRRSQSGSRLGRRSPGKRTNSIPRTSEIPPTPPIPPPRPSSSTAGVADGSTGNLNGGAANSTNSGYFDAGKWAEQIGSEHFVPHQHPQHPPPPVPPRQPSPNTQQPQPQPQPQPQQQPQPPVRPLKKPKPVRRGTFVIGDDGDSSTPDSGSEPQQPKHKEAPTSAAGGAGDFGGPTAMDIDSPSPGVPGQPSPNVTDKTSLGGTAAANASGIPSNATQMNGGSRNIPVEPSRPEWRAGNVDQAQAQAQAKATATAAAAAAAAAEASKHTAAGANSVPVGGSEDSEEFRASLADIRKVAPFSEGTEGIMGGAGSGLSSFGDLKTNLPFESRAASATNANHASLPNRKPVGGGRKRTISFPKPPTPPHPPPALAVPGLQPSTQAWDTYVSEFRHYMLEWTVFNNQYVDHFIARRNDIELQRRQHGGDFGWLISANDDDNAGINRYLDWMEQDEAVRARWSAACSGHDANVRQFMAFRERMKQAL